MKLTDKFVFAERVEALLETAIRTQKNCILFGPGGHAKSEMVEFFLKKTNTPFFTLAFGEGMTEERMFGGLDMAAFKETGAVRYRVEHSFMAYEYAIFEELFDAPTNVLLALKDILTSRRFRNGEQVFEIKTKVIFVCTNRSADEVATDLSSKALLERFPLRLEVRWKRYDESAFHALFERVLGAHETNALLAHVCARTHEKGGWISPRTAIHAAEVVRTCGWDSLEFLSDIDEEMLRLVREEKEKIQRELEQRAELEKISKLLREICLEAAKHSSSPIKLLQAAKRIQVECIAKINSMQVVDALSKMRKQVMEACEFEFDRLQRCALYETKI